MFTMYESPRSLQDACIDYICDNVLSLCEVHVGDAEEPPNSISTTICVSGRLCRKASTNATSVSTAPPVSSTSAQTQGQLATRLSLKYPDAFISTQVSERLLSTLSEKKILTDLTIILFNAKSMRLRHVRLKDASRLTTKGLRILKQHNIVDLVANGLKVTVNDLIGCLGEWTIKNLRSLSVARGSFMDCSRYCVVVALSKLRSLRTLDVSGTEFNQHGLEIVVEDLPFLESLNISCTMVDDITPLAKCKERLKTLLMYNLKLNESGNWIAVLRDLNELRTLDISDEKDGHAFEMFAPVRPEVTELLEAIDCMPHLCSLDLSGNDEVNAKVLKEFVKGHSHLRFLGLVHLHACYEDCFVNPANEDYRTDLLVSGTATDSQIVEGLRRYRSRPIYVQKCLFYLFRLTQNSLEPRADIIKLILPAMREYPLEFGVQMAATACLYNLTKFDLAVKIHPSILKQIVELTLTAMESYPTNYQLQKNTLLTLCSDRILQDVSFDRFRCAKLILNSLLAFDDALMNRMSVAICSILAAKISTEETSMLGAQPQYMAKLLEMVKSTVRSRSVDITLKFTLSALWNLTDESAVTCKVFLEKGGMELFLEVLESFEGEFSVETKVLGLLNNLAEVEELRPKLMQQRFIKMLSSLLESVHIDVSYFAAGIAAHLLSDGAKLWAEKPSEPSREELADQLVRTVAQWKTPQGEMVAYRSFRPFFPLLRCTDEYPVQLWAVWAIHHVCTKNPKRYCGMLTLEGGIEALKRLEKTYAERPTQTILLLTLCQSILDILESNPCKR